MSCKCSGLHTNASYRKDPTRTITIRSRFERDAVSRYSRLSRAIWQFIVEQRAFGDPKAPIRNRQFEFVTDAQKITGFMRWLRQMERSGDIAILPVTEGGALPWMNSYIDTAYQAGIRAARGDLRSIGVDVGADTLLLGGFNQPVHVDAVRVIYTRVYEELDGITREMDRQISRTLAQGIAEGRNPIDIARQLTNRVDAIGKNRARVLARTETISAHHQAKMNSFEQAGLDDIEVVAEWETGGDGRVCEKCKALDKKFYTIEKARSLIPVHPNCRCTTVPVLREDVGQRKIIS